LRLGGVPELEAALADAAAASNSWGVRILEQVRDVLLVLDWDHGHDFAGLWCPANQARGSASQCKFDTAMASPNGLQPQHPFNRLTAGMFMLRMQYQALGIVSQLSRG
jgi:hypothetical protein